MNAAIILGRLTRDPVIKASQSGMTIARFTLAVNRLNKNGQNQEADFINCVAFGKTAEAYWLGCAIKYLYRYPLKGLLQDIDKAIECLKKLREIVAKKVQNGNALE